MLLPNVLGIPFSRYIGESDLAFVQRRIAEVEADGADVLLTPQEIVDLLYNGWRQSNFLYIPFARKSGVSYSIIGPNLSINRSSAASEFNRDLLLKQVLPNEPRIEFDSNGLKGHLIEEQSTNVFPQGTDLSGTYSGVTNATVTLNQSISPSGDLDATLLVGSASWLFRHSIAGVNVGTWTISVWVKAVTVGVKNTFRLSVSGNNISGNLTATGEWQKFKFTVADGGSTACGLMRDSSGNESELYVWGMVVEEQPEPTSTILNSSTAATRLIDLFNAPLTGTLTDYVLVVHFKRDLNAPLPAATSNLIDKTTASQNDKGRINISAAGSISYFSTATAYLQFIPITLLLEAKYVLRAASGTISQYCNGTAYGTGVNALDELDFLFFRGTLNANIQSIQLLPLKSEAECLTISEV